MLNRILPYLTIPVGAYTASCTPSISGGGMISCQAQVHGRYIELVHGVDILTYRGAALYLVRSHTTKGATLNGDTVIYHLNYSVCYTVFAFFGVIWVINLFEAKLW